MTFSIVLVVLPAVWQHRCYSQTDTGHAAVPQPPPVIPSASDFLIVLVALPAVWQHRCYSQPDTGRAAVPQPPPVIPSAGDFLIVLVALDPHSGRYAPVVIPRPAGRGICFFLAVPHRPPRMLTMSPSSNRRSFRAPVTFLAQPVAP